MKRVSLALLDSDDLIEIILVHPMAGKHIGAIIEGSEDGAVLPSYTVVYTDHTVALRVPGGLGPDATQSHILIWEDGHRTPWCVDSKLLPRDAGELRLLTLAVTTGRKAARGQLVSAAKAA